MDLLFKFRLPFCVLPDSPGIVDRPSAATLELYKMRSRERRHGKRNYVCCLKKRQCGIAKFVELKVQHVVSEVTYECRNYAVKSPT